MPRPEHLSVVIPAFDEARRLQDSLSRITTYLRERFARWDILIVDDGSTDGTADLVTRLHGSDARIHLLRLPMNQGKGAAVRAGMLAARGDLRLFSDADLSTPIEELESALSAIDAGAAIAIASRGLPDSRLVRRQRWIRERLGRTFNALVRRITGLPFADTQCGFKLFTQEAADAIFRRTTVDRFAFDVEVLLLANRLGYHVVEFPARWHHAAGSKVHLVRDALEMAGTTLRLRWRYRRRGHD